MSKQTVLDFFSAETEEQCKVRIYKHTDCGAWLAFNAYGIEIGSIVEGADFGTMCYPLNYADNFTSKDIQDRIDAVEKEADAIWEWANTVHEGDEETWMEQGIDAPDVDFEYRHLGQSSRSA